MSRAIGAIEATAIWMSIVIAWTLIMVWLADHTQKKETKE